MSDPHQHQPDLQDDIVDAVVGIVGEGPLALEEVVRRLRGSDLLDDVQDLDDVELAEELEDLLFEDDRVWLGPGDRVASIDGLTTDRVFTHRLTEAEQRTGRLIMDPDLEVIGWTGADRAVALATGGELAADFDADRRDEAAQDDRGDGTGIDHWVGPEGWLDGFRPGDVLALRVTHRGIEVSSIEDLADDEPERAALTVAVEHRIAPARGGEAAPIVFDALVVDPGAFTRPVRPVGELLEAIGLQRRGWEWGRASPDWLTSGEAYERDRRERMSVDWGFDACCHEALETVFDVFEPFALAPDLHPVGREQAVEIARALAHGPVAPAFVSEVLGWGAGGDDRLEDFATRLVELSGRHAAPAHFVVAANAERVGAADVAVHHLEAATRLDPGFAPAAGELAAYVLDTGNLDRAIRLLQQAGATDEEPELAWLLEQRDRTAGRYRDVGRNDPCPCASGRKYKACCERNPLIPLADRIDLLVHKLAGFALRPHRRQRVEELADLADHLAPAGDDLPLTTESLLDLAMFEGDIAEDYLRERWDLLPRDERAVLEAAVAAPRLLWEVTGVDEGRSSRLRDVRSGQEWTVIERAGSEGREVGEHLLARVVPVGGVPVFLGVPVTIPPRLRPSLLALIDEGPDAFALVAWLCEAAALPVQASQDPTHRGDLAVLLRQLPEPDPEGLGFDEHRLRRMLDLDQ